MKYFDKPKSYFMLTDSKAPIKQKNMHVHNHNREKGHRLTGDAWTMRKIVLLKMSSKSWDECGMTF